jgi:broad specificity phosphatase PhoE
MKKLLLILCVAAISCNDSKSQESENEDGMTTFYFARHAEKQNGADPELTATGNKRAAEWVNYFFVKNVDHVLSSDTKRTRATAAPLARAQKVETEIYDVSSVTGKSLLEQYRGKTVVLYGHSNTIHNYVNDLQSDTTYAELDESDFDTFFIVRIDENGNTSATKETMDMSDE